MFPYRSRWMAFGLRRVKVLGLLSVQLVWKLSNLCGHGPPTLQTGRQTYGQTTCDRKTALCTKVHRAVKRMLYTRKRNTRKIHRVRKKRGQSILGITFTNLDTVSTEYSCIFTGCGIRDKLTSFLIYTFRVPSSS